MTTSGAEHADPAVACGKKQAAAVDPRIASLPIVKKYAAQLKEVERLQLELAHQQHRSEQLQTEQAEFREELRKEKERLSKLDSLSKELKRKRDETLDELRAMDKEEQSQRKALSEKFQQTIGEISTRMESDAEEQMAVVQRNRDLKSRLSVMGQQVEIKSGQYEQLLKTRDVELRLAEARAEHMHEMAKGDRLRAEAQNKQLAVEVVKEKELKSQLDELKARFDDLQSTIIKSNDVFRGYKAEMEKMTKRIKVLENDRGCVLKRYGTKKKAADDAEAELAAQQAKHDGLVKAGDTVQGLLARLRSEKQDYECWKAACPEEYKAALAELPAGSPALEVLSLQKKKKK
eukprot:TRINITY_DN1935_c0_g3_i1.p1 TRINITY_DN1935_c0_g3~~TRINITY_DN1935_c0_g3_i1.p1  ORF type:complete len:347 (+),score=217.11 TRINITY_DN1935_c0_g3_i1:89-1129(+)